VSGLASEEDTQPGVVSLEVDIITKSLALTVISTEGGAGRMTDRSGRDGEVSFEGIASEGS
jgi:hypothetical protein